MCEDRAVFVWKQTNNDTMTPNPFPGLREEFPDNVLTSEGEKIFNTQMKMFSSRNYNNQRNSKKLRDNSQ